MAAAFVEVLPMCGLKVDNLWNQTFEEFWLRVMQQVVAVGNDCRLSIHGSL